MWVFRKKKTRIKKFQVTGDSRHIYRKGLGNASFQRDMEYRDFKNLPRRTASDKVLGNSIFEIASNPKYKGLASVFYNCFVKKADDISTHTGTEINFEDQKLAIELHRPITRKFKIR